MIIKVHPLLLIVLSIVTYSNGQSQRVTLPDPFQNYYYDYKLANPALTGIQGKHVITTAYFGRSGLMDSYYGAYEANIGSIKSGAGLTAMYEDLGFLRNYHVGGLYSKQIAFNDVSGLRFGTHLYFQKEIFDSSKYGFILDGDPLIITEKRKNTSVALDLGVIYYLNSLTIGAGVKNIQVGSGSNEISGGDNEVTSVNFLVSREFGLTPHIQVTPSCLLVSDLHDCRIGVNAALEIHRWILLGAGNRFFSGGGSNFTFNAGLNIKDWVQLIMHVYSAANDDLRRDNSQYIETLIRVTIPENGDRKRKVG